MLGPDPYGAGKLDRREQLFFGQSPWARRRHDRSGPAGPDDPARRRSPWGSSCGSWRHSPDDSAALVIADVRLGDYQSWMTCATSPRHATCSPSTTNTCPPSTWPALAAAGFAVRPGAGALRCTPRTSRHARAADRDRRRRARPGAPVRDGADVEEFAGEHGWPVVLKAVAAAMTAVASGSATRRGRGRRAGARGAADGRGVRAVRAGAGRAGRPVAARAGRRYPVVETVQRDGICARCWPPRPGSTPSRPRWPSGSPCSIANELDVTGLLAVELFATAAGLLVNELAMRPHNSGHWTIDGARPPSSSSTCGPCSTCRSAPALSAPVVVMVNLLAATTPTSSTGYDHVMAHDPGGQGPLLRQGSTAGPQDRPRHRVRHRPATSVRDGPARRRDYLEDRHRGADGRAQPAGRRVMGSDSDWPVMSSPPRRWPSSGCRSRPTWSPRTGCPRR